MTSSGNYDVLADDAKRYGKLIFGAPFLYIGLWLIYGVAYLARGREKARAVIDAIRAEADEP